MITNIALSDIHKRALNFCIKNTMSKWDEAPITTSNLICQINNAEVLVEDTPYYCIIKFIHNGFSSNIFDKTIDLQVLSENNVPLMFHLHFNGGFCVEFEYYKADSSAMDDGLLTEILML